MSSFDMDSFLQGFHLYCFDNCRANTYIQNVIKDDALPNYDRTNMCFVLINEKEESSKVSSIVSVNKPGYVEKLPFKPLLPKEGKKKKRSKRREETVSSPKHVAPIIVFDESELVDVPMPITYSSDHDWEKHSTYDIENLYGTNSENDEVNNCCVLLVLSMFLPMMMCLQLNALQKIVILLNLLLLRLLRMTMFMWGVLILLCIWLMIRMFYVIVILLILFMMLLKVIMREGNMVLCISIILSFPS
jgi:hypothetical protein